MSEDPLEPLSDLARAWATANPPSSGGAAAWARLDAGLERQVRRRRARFALVGAAAIAVGAVAGRGLLLRSERLTYAVEGAAARTDGYIPRVAAPLARVRFSDGTEVGLEHGSRAWVVGTGADGAQIRLEDGRAHFAVVHRPHARWSVEAGPFVVSVTGGNATLIGGTTERDVADCIAAAMTRTVNDSVIPGIKDYVSMHP